MSGSHATKSTGSGRWKLGGSHQGNFAQTNAVTLESAVTALELEAD